MNDGVDILYNMDISYIRTTLFDRKCKSVCQCVSTCEETFRFDTLVTVINQCMFTLYTRRI